MHRNARLILAGVGLAAGLGATALPMLPVWLQHDAAPALTEAMTVQGGSTVVLVDLGDSSSDADRAAVEREYGISLTPNSIVARDNKLYKASVPAAQVGDLLARLRQDSRVEAASPEVTVSLSPDENSGPAQQQIATFEVDNPDAVVRHALEPLRRETRMQGYTVVEYIYDVDGSLRRSTRSVPAGMRLLDDNAGTRPNDPRYDEQWNFKMVGAEDAWKKTRGKGAIVAVIDTGVQMDCRDFKLTSFTKGYDFVNKRDRVIDDNGHGTHVAGTIAESTNNNEGVAGLAYEATIMPLKVLSAGGSGSSADIADAIRWAADKGANVINMSLGAPVPMSVVENACKYARKKGVTIVCAAGNSFKEGVGYPAAYPECVAVSSVGPSGNLAKYSSWGKQVALAAPGGDKIDSGNDKDGILQNTVYGGKDDYYSFQGTSMASPHVAAAAGLIVSQGIKDPAKVRDILTKTATPKNDKKKYGAGVLNVAKATGAAEGETNWKLRHLLAFGLGGLMLLAGGRRRNPALRAGMAGALAAGFFGPDLVTNWVGADSAWNLLSFSVLVPAILALAWRNRPALKIAGAAAVGVGVCLFANWHNGTLPFTTATFGAAALPWTATNLVAAFGIALAAGRRAATHLW